MDGSLHDFEAQIDRNSVAEQEVLRLEGAVETLVSGSDRLFPSQIRRIYAAISSKLRQEQGEPASEVTYDADFDLAGELSAQLKAINALRSSIYDAFGQLKETVSIREVKEIVTASSTLFNTLMKHHQDVQSMERRRAIEAATIETLKQISKESTDTYDLFMKIFEEKLEGIK